MLYRPTLVERGGVHVLWDAQDDVLIVGVESEDGRLRDVLHVVRVPDDVVLPPRVHQVFILDWEDGIPCVVLATEYTERVRH